MRPWYERMFEVYDSDLIEDVNRKILRACALAVIFSAVSMVLVIAALVIAGLLR